MDRDAVLLDVDGVVARITLNRPEVLNAENMEWVHGLDAAVNAVAAQRDVRAVVIRGAGRAFCAGLDLAMFSREGMPPGFYEVQERAFRSLELLDAITVAAVHGHCHGGGLQLAIACDIRISSSDCRFSLTAIQKGLFPGMAPFRLPRLIGLGPARRLILSGEMFGADEAFRLGLVDHLVPADRFEGGVEDVLGMYLKAQPPAVIASKRMMDHAFESPLDAVYQQSRTLLSACRAALDVSQDVGAGDPQRSV
jgi:enoyl-CoA hydratase/carnithine racemase